MVTDHATRPKCPVMRSKGILEIFWRAVRVAVVTVVVVRADDILFNVECSYMAGK